MFPGVDSSFARPNLQTIQAAVAAGVRNWSGYLTTRPGVNIAAPWPASDFDITRQAGSMPIAYCSGWDDPTAVKEAAAAAGVRACLDVESGIRGDGPWVQPWLDESGAGLYGNPSVHAGRTAAFHILADYLTYDPHSTWPAWLHRPAAPCGWQWRGTHVEFGLGVDSTWLDDWFLTGISPVPAPVPAPGPTPVFEEDKMRSWPLGSAWISLWKDNTVRYNWFDGTKINWQPVGPANSTLAYLTGAAVVNGVCYVEGFSDRAFDSAGKPKHYSTQFSVVSNPAASTAVWAVEGE